MVSIQSSHTFPSKCKCSSPFGNLMSCSLLTPQHCSFNCLSCGNVIYGISYLCSLGCLSCGDVICGTTIVCLTVCTTIGIALTTVGIVDGSTLPLITFYTLKYLHSYSFFIPKLEGPPFSTIFFLVRALLGKFATTFFLFINVIFISSLII